MTRKNGREKVAALAERQQGRVTIDQMLWLGMERHEIRLWREQRFLVPVVRGVYAVGHRAPSREADLWTAVLYAGPGAMLSHVTAAHWLGLLDFPAPAIEVTTPRAGVKSIDGVARVYSRRIRERVIHNGLPTTTVADTIVDVAAVSSLRAVRRALSKLDYQDGLDFDDLISRCVQGRTGSKLLRAALRDHDPELAYVNGPLEERLLELCREWELPQPRFGVSLYGIETDAYWSELDLVVEVDGYDNHASRAQVNRDHINDVVLRSHGLTVFRYAWPQLHGVETELVHRELSGWVGRAQAAQQAA